MQQVWEFGDDADEGTLGWQERSLCAQTDPEAFFPEKGGSTREAKKVCRSCDVRSECLEYALAHDERFGIWAVSVSVSAGVSRSALSDRSVVVTPSSAVCAARDPRLRRRGCVG